MNKKVSMLVLVGLISAQTLTPLAPSITAFADEIKSKEKIESVTNDIENESVKEEVSKEEEDTSSAEEVKNLNENIEEKEITETENVTNNIEDKAVKALLPVVYTDSEMRQELKNPSQYIYPKEVTLNFYTGTATVDGKIITSGTKITEPGVHTLKITDGNLSKTYNFSVIDNINGKEIVSFENGYGVSVAVDSEGNVYTWGYNGYGQLGDGTSSTSIIPIKVNGNGGAIGTSTKIVSISAGVSFMSAIDSEGNLYTWGRNNNGQLGDGTSSNSIIPVETLLTLEIEENSIKEREDNNNIYFDIKVPNALANGQQIAYSLDNSNYEFVNICSGFATITIPKSEVRKNITIKIGASNEVVHNVNDEIVIPIKLKAKAEINKENGGMMLSTAGLGLRFFTSLENIATDEVATYYITTASNKSETPKFEVKSTVLNGDYSQIKTSIEFSELSKLETGIDTKLYVKRVVKGQEPTYIELKSGVDYLTNGFNISDNKSVSVNASKGDNNVVQLNKSVISGDSFDQGVSNIYWNSTGMVVEGTPTNNGSSDDFVNAKVSMLFKDASGNYIKAEGSDKNLEFRGMYRDGKYKVTIPYDVLENAKSFELRLIGSNIQTTDVLTKGTVEEFKIGMKDDKLYKLSEGTGHAVNLSIENLSNSLSDLSSVKVTTDKATQIRQFSIVGEVSIPEMDKIDSSIKYTIVGKKAGEVVFEQLATKINNNGNYNGFKTNLSLTTLKEVGLNNDEEISLELKVEYLGNTISIDLNSSEAAVSTTDEETKETFEMTSKDGKAVITKK